MRGQTLIVFIDPQAHLTMLTSPMLTVQDIPEVYRDVFDVVDAVHFRLLGMSNSTLQVRKRAEVTSSGRYTLETNYNASSIKIHNRGHNSLEDLSKLLSFLQSSILYDIDTFRSRFKHHRQADDSSAVIIGLCICMPIYNSKIRRCRWAILVDMIPLYSNHRGWMVFPPCRLKGKKIT
jgi:hypothetical protein